jgi:hypothetical protein
MKRFTHAALTDEVARFQAEVRQLALAAAHEIFRAELARRSAELPAAGPSGRKEAAGAAAPGRTRRSPAPPADGTHGTSAQQAAARQSEQLSLPLTTEPIPVPGQDHEPSKPASTSGTGTGGKRVRWTRETIVSELATWMLSGTTIEAAFVTRHGPPGLVAAARRIFGRFEAALNVAALHVSKLYPDGPPERLT